MTDAWIEIIAGSLAGSTAKLIEYPFDTTKVKLQAQDSRNPVYRGAVDCMWRTFRSEGIMGLYRGLSAPLVAASAENATLFSVFNAASRWTLVMNWIGPSQMKRTIACGSLSGFVASFLLTPIELIKCKIQVTTLAGKQHLTILQHIKTIFKESGLRGFWRAQHATAIRETGGSASWFGAQMFVSRSLENTEAIPSGLAQFLGGAAAGIAYNLSFFPADTVKSRLQTETMMGRPKQSFMSAFATIYREGGIPNLYRGALITCVRAAPSSAVIFWVFGKTRNYLESL